MAEIMNIYKSFVRKPEGKDLFEDLGTDGTIILNWILWKQDRGFRLVSSGSG